MYINTCQGKEEEADNTSIEQKLADSWEGMESEYFQSEGKEVSVATLLLPLGHGSSLRPAVSISVIMCQHIFMNGL